MSGQDFDVDVLRLRRFLHTGLDPVKNFYCSPDDVSTEMISFKKEYDDLDGLLESLAAKGKGDLIASEILKAHSSDSSPHRRAVIYVLGRAISMGARDAVMPCPVLNYRRFEHGSITTAARGIAFDVIPDGRPEEVLQLFRFIRQPTTRDGSVKKVQGGSGAGVRKMFAAWYNRQNCYTLTRPRNAGYTHKDVIKLMHVKAADVEHRVLFDYLLFGYKNVAEKYRENHEAASYVALLEKIEELKGLAAELSSSGGASEEKKEAAAKKCLKLIREHGLGFHLIPNELYGQGEVWSAMLSHLNMRDVFKNIKCLVRNGFLESGDHPVAKKLVNVLDDIPALEGSGLLPETIYRAYCDVVHNFKHPVKSEEAKAKEAKGKPSKRKKKDAKKDELDKKLNPSCNEVRLAIINLVKPSYKNLRPLSKPRRILVCADNRANMEGDKAMCWGAYNMTCLDAVAITTVSLANTPNADLVVCTFGKAELVTILTKFNCKKHGVIHLKKFLSEAPKGLMDIVRPLDYAIETRSKFDAIVILTGSHNYCDNAKLYERLKRYRAEISPLARWVVSACGTKKLSTAHAADPLMFDFAGFDRSVPKMIASFIDERF